MADLPPGLDQLPAELGSAATPPPFGALVERAGDRRRRRAAGAAVAAMLTIIAAASGIGVVSTHRSAAPPVTTTQRHRHHPSDLYTWINMPEDDSWSKLTPEQRVHWVLGGRMEEYSVDEQGDTLTLWNREDRVTGRYHEAWALLTVGASEHHAALVGGQVLQVQAVPGGFFLNAWGHGPVLIGLDGQVTPFTHATTGKDTSGDVVFYADGGKGTVALADPSTRTWWKDPVAQGTQAASFTVGHDGSYWVWGKVGGRPDTVQLRREPCADPTICRHTLSTSSTTGASPGYVATYGTRVAAFTSGDGVDVATVVRWVVSPDGRHFHVYPRSVVPFGDVDSMVVTGNGRLVVADAEGRLWASTDDTWLRFARVDVGHKVWDLKTGLHGDVLAEVQSNRQPKLLMIDGRTLHTAAWLWGSPWPGGKTG